MKFKCFCRFELHDKPACSEKHNHRDCAYPHMECDCKNDEQDKIK
jgi:hypothetical protein